MFGDFVVVTGRAEESTLAVDNLERDTTSSEGDNRNTSMEGLGNLDLETFASGELKGNVSIIQERVQDCIEIKIKTTSRALAALDLRWSLGGILMTTISSEYS